MIEDFGEKIDGAAKDRWKTFRSRLDRVADDQIAKATLSEIFPAPDYAALIESGVSPFLMGFVRAVRETIPNKPRKRHQLASWAQNVALARRFCTQVIDGKIGETNLRERLEQDLYLRQFRGKCLAYERFGHANSLKDLTIGANIYSVFNGERFDPPKKIWAVLDSRNRPLGHGDTLKAALDAYEQSDKFGQWATRKTGKSKFDLYRYKTGPEVWIGKKIGKSYIDIASFPDVSSARRYLIDNLDEIEARFEALRAMPEERGTMNRAREGASWRHGEDITPDRFMETFGFRGVQFGNYVEGPRRQQDLNNAHDAFMDLADLLGCEPSSLSLGGTLGIAFGARGKGGRNCGAAHYESEHQVINLTKNNGAGSLAHEWFHALDNHVARRFGAKHGFATDLPCSTPAAIALHTLAQAMRQQPVFGRSKTADRYRSSPYYATTIELAARSFENWVIDGLARSRSTNDYLANVIDEDVYAAEQALLGSSDDRYPYVRRVELPALRDIFGRCFEPGGPLGLVLTPAASVELAIEDRGGPPAGEDSAPDSAFDEIDFGLG